MGKVVRYVWIVFIFIGVNLYLGILTIHLLEICRLKDSPLAVDVLKDDTPNIAAVTDINNDGNDEIILSRVENFPERNEVWIFDPFKTGETAKPFTGKIQFPSYYRIFDVYLDKLSKSCVFRFLDCSTGNFIIKEVDYLGKTKKQDLPLDKIRNKMPEAAFSFSNPVFADLESNGRAEMLITLYSFYIHLPRGVVCFDPETGKLLWEYNMGTMVQYSETKDLDNDGFEEVIISTHAINNGAVLNGTDDAHSYIIVLNHNGNERWKRVTGDWYSRAQPTTADLDGDHSLEIITAVASHRAHPAVKGKLFIFDGLTGKTRASYLLPHASFSRPFVHFAGDGAPRIFVGDAAGCVRMFDQRLHLIKSISEGLPIHILNASVSSQKWSYLIALTQERLAAFDWNLERKVFDYRFEHPIPIDEFIYNEMISAFHTRESKGTLIAADKLIWLHPAERSFLRTVKYAFTSGFLAAVVGMLLFNAFFLYSLHSVNSSTTHLAYTARKKVREISRFLHIVQETAQQIKNPVSTIAWTAEKLKQCSDSLPESQTRESYMQLSDFLAEDAKILKRQASRLLRLTQLYKPRFRETALKPLLQHMADHYRTLTTENIHICLEMEEEITLSLDEELFKEVLSNLLDNALDAMAQQGSGQLILSAVPVTSPVTGNIEQVLIELEDTGCGIDEIDLPRVFEPLFSKKQRGKGAGIGLFICRRIITAHKGKIDIFSRKNFGAKVTINLPLKRKKGKTA
jgi:signal transduction histidine kinase